MTGQPKQNGPSPKVRELVERSRHWDGKAGAALQTESITQPPDGKQLQCEDDAFSYQTTTAPYVGIRT